jgi:tRNA dimethylallyltransferase
LHALLSERAPWAAATIEPGDRQRIVRSLELLEAGELSKPRESSELWSAHMRRPTTLVGLVMEREVLYARIDARVERMIALGAREEVFRADRAGASGSARKALGFKELLRGDVEAMKRRSRNYARRQLTWMRKLGAVRVIDVSSSEAAQVAGQILDSAGP